MNLKRSQQMDENEIVMKLAIGIVIGAVFLGGVYLYRKSKHSEKEDFKNKDFSPVFFSNEGKEKITLYFEKLKNEEKNYYKRNYLNFYFDLNLSEDKASNTKGERISGPYELGLSFDESQLVYGYIKSNLLKVLKPNNDLSNSEAFILAQDYHSFLGKKEALEEVRIDYEIDKLSNEKYQRVLKQLEKELESLKQS